MKKLATLLLACLAVCAFSTGLSLTANAGINTNSPLGEGLLENGELTTSFTKVDDTDPSAYSLETTGTDFSVVYNAGEWQEMLVGTPVPKEMMAKENVKVDLIYKLTAMPPAKDDDPGTSQGQLLITPGTALTDQFTYGYVLVANASLAEVPDYRQSKQPTDPASKVIYHMEGGEFDFASAGERGYAWRPTTLKSYIDAAADHAAYFRIRATLNADKTWCDISLAAGLDQWGSGSIAWVVGTQDGAPTDGAATITNWAPFDSTKDFYLNVWARYVNGMAVDGAELAVSYTEAGQTVTETIFETNMDDKGLVITETGAEAKADCFMARGCRYDSISSAKILNVVNPGEETRLASLNPLKVDTRLEKTFEMTAEYTITTLPATRKIGIAFGLDSYDTSLKAPTGGASFLYLTRDENGKTILGADNIAQDGTVTPSGETHELAASSRISLHIVGNQDGSVTVTVGGTEVYSFPAIKLNGNIALAQTGTGDTTYGIFTDTFSLSGFVLTENEGEQVTATFDGNYFNGEKFEMSSVAAPAEYYTVPEGVAHEPVGMVAEDGKLGFYASGTNTRLMFKDKYADFVLQFDYISEPYQTRAYPAALKTNAANIPNRYSPLYILFGADSTELPQTYALGLLDGNATQYFWGAESLITYEGKWGQGLAAALTTVTPLADGEDTATAIPCYYATEGVIDPTPVYSKPAEGGYSLYNKTSRIKLVVINNKVALYAAPVTDGVAGEYVKLWQSDDKIKVTNSYGFVGLGTDAPAWATVDNLAITPISTETALEQGLNAQPAADLVADVDPADMETDVKPTPLAKPVLTADTAAKKVTWTAVTGAKEYEVVVKLDTETKLEQTVSANEIDLSSLTAAGTYKVTVTAIPADEKANLKSSGTVDYVVTAQTTDPGTTPGTDPGTDPGTTPGTTPGTDPGTTPGTDPGTTPGTDPKPDEGGCNGLIGGGAAILFAAIVLFGGAILFVRKRKND